MVQKKQKTKVLMVLTTLFLTFCFMGISKGESDAKKGDAVTDRIVVAKVNGQPIYKEALAPYTEQELKKFRKYGMARRESPEIMKRMEKRALDQVIAQELLSQESQHRKIDDIEKKVDDGIQKLKIKYRTEENFKNYLKAKQITEDDLRKYIKKNIYVISYLEEKGIQNPEIPEEEMKAYYEESKSNYWKDEYIRAGHILIKADENASQEEKDAARQKAEKIRAEILKGRDFSEAAREYSEDGRAATGGGLDYITRGFMPPEFDRAAFAMNKNEVSNVVQTKFGFHIIKVFDKKPAGYSPYDEVRDFIKKYLQEEVAKKKLMSHMEELMTKAKIEVFLE